MRSGNRILMIFVAFMLGFGVMFPAFDNKRWLVDIVRAPPPYDDTVVWVQNRSVNIGDNFTINVSCEPGQPIKSFEFSIYYDPSIIRANSVEEGNIFSGYDTFFSDGTINNTGGRITSIYDLIVGQGNVSNRGTFVTISFTAIKNGYCPIRFLYNYPGATDPAVSNETEYIPAFFHDGVAFVRQEDASTPGRIDGANYPIDKFYRKGNNYYPVNMTIIPKSLQISGRSYQYGVTEGWYSAYFRSLSSDTNDRPVAMVQDNYTLTMSPSDFVLLQPHKGTTQGRVGNRVQSNAVVYENSVYYPEFYEQIGSSLTFATLKFFYEHDQIKEEMLINDKEYLQSRFESQCRPQDFNIVNLTYSTVIRVYNISDSDSNTLGVVYGNQRVNFKQYGSFVDGEFTTNESISFTDTSGNTVYYIPELYAYDYVFYNTGNESVDHKIKLNKTVTMTRFGNLEVTILVPYWWLVNENTSYPIFVDPPMYGKITQSIKDSFEWATAEGALGSRSGIIRLNNSDYYAFACTGENGSDNDGFVRVLQVWGNGTIRKRVISSYEYDASDGAAGMLAHLPGTDKYFVTYRDTGSAVSKLVTLQIWDTNGTISKRIIDTQNLAYNSPYLHNEQMTAHIWAIFMTDYGAGSYDGFLETFWINDTGTINNTHLDIEEFDETYGLVASLCKVDNDTIAISYMSGSSTGDFSIVTHNITNTGLIANSYTDRFASYEANPYSWNWINRIGLASDMFGLTYVTTNDDIYFKTIAITEEGMIAPAVTDTLLVLNGGEVEGLGGTFVVRDPIIYGSTGILGCAFQGYGGGELDGYMYTWNVSDDGTLGDTPISSYEYETASTFNFPYATNINNSDHYLIIQGGPDNDGWAKTVYIKTQSPASYPTNSNPYPLDGDHGLSISRRSLNISVTDSKGQLMNVNFTTNVSGTWKLAQTNTSVSNGTVRCLNTSWITSYNKKYWWNVSTQDAIGQWDNDTYNFTTNYFPTVTGVSPPNGSGCEKIPTCQIVVADQDGDSIVVDWYENSSGTWVHSQKNVSAVANGSYYWIYHEADVYNQMYFWKVTINDTFSNKTFVYSIRPQTFYLDLLAHDENITGTGFISAFYGLDKSGSAYYNNHNLTYMAIGNHYQSRNGYYVYYNESNGTGGKYQLYDNASTSDHASGSLVISKNGTLWLAYGGYFNTINGDLWKTVKTNGHVAGWLLEKSNYITDSGGCGVTITTTKNNSLLSFNRNGANDAATTGIQYERYNMNSTATARPDKELIDGMTWEGSALCPQYSWSRYDPRYNYQFITASFHQTTPNYQGSAPFIYTDNNGTTWKRGNGTAYTTFPIEFDVADIPFNNVANNSYSYEYGAIPGVGVDGTKYMIAIDNAYLYFYRHNGTGWAKTRMSEKRVVYSQNHAGGTTLNYVFVAYSRMTTPKTLTVRVSLNDGISWSDEYDLITLQGSNGPILGISYAQPIQYVDDKVRLIYTYSSANGTYDRENLNWLEFEIEEAARFDKDQGFWNVSFCNTSKTFADQGFWNTSFSNEQKNRNIGFWNVSFSNHTAPRNFGFWNVSFRNYTDTVSVHWISQTPSDIKFNMTQNITIVYNITTGWTHVNQFFLSQVVNLTVPPSQKQYNWSYRYPPSWKDALTGMRANNRNEGRWYEKFARPLNTSVPPTIGYIGEAGVFYNGSREIHIMKTGSNYTLFNLSLKIRHLFPQEWKLDRTSIQNMKDKRNYTVNREAFVLTNFSFNGMPWWTLGRYLNSTTICSFNYYYDPLHIPTEPLQVYYVNSSYTTGRLSTSPYAQLLRTVYPSTPYAYQNRNSSYWSANFTISPLGYIGTTKATRNFSIGFESPSTTTKSYYIKYAWYNYSGSDFNNTNTTRITANHGLVWARTKGTVDAWLSFANPDVSDIIMYRVYANNSQGEQVWSDIRSDAIDFSNIRPNSPNVLRPNSTAHKKSGDVINVTIRWAGDPNLDTCWVNTSLWDNTTHTFVRYIQNQSIPYSTWKTKDYYYYNWDTDHFNIPTGIYDVRAVARDPYGLTSTSIGQPFTFNQTHTRLLPWWNVSFSNTLAFKKQGYWNVSFSSPLTWRNQGYWNISFNAEKTWENYGFWNISFRNTSSEKWRNQGYWNLSFMNTSEEWKNEGFWNVTFKNGTYDVVYVDDNAPAGWYNDTHLHTIQEGVNVVNHTGKIYVWAGNYTNHVIINKTLSLIGNGSTSILSLNRRTENGIYINNADNTNITKIVVKIANTSIRVENSHNVTVNYSTLRSNMTSGIYAIGSRYGRYDHNDITSNYTGIQVAGYSGNTNITNNSLHNSVWSAIYLAGSSGNCSVYWNHINTSQYVTLTTYGNRYENNTFRGGAIGLVLMGARFNYVSNNTINITSSMGMYMVTASNNTIRDNDMTGNSTGVWLNAQSENNTLFNNIIIGVIGDVAKDDCVNNTWNITKTLGTNIIGGPYIGGNYYSDNTNPHVGDGFSTPYTITGTIKDYHPLVYKGWTTTSFFWNVSLSNTLFWTPQGFWNVSFFSPSSVRDFGFWNTSFMSSLSNKNQGYWNVSFSNETFLFIIDPYPSNVSSGVSLGITVHVDINQSRGKKMNVTWMWGNDSTCPNFLGVSFNVSNSTVSKWFTSAITNSKVYYWKVLVNDGWGHFENRTYHYTTAGAGAGGSGMQVIQNYSGLGIIGVVGIFGILALFWGTKKKRKKENEK